VKVPLLDLKAQYQSIKADIDSAVAKVMTSQNFVLGPLVEECERAIAKYTQCSHAVGVSSGTDALVICLMAAGIGRDDEVITTPYTFFATAGSIARVGAKPVFVDIDPTTYNLDVTQIEAKLTPRTRAIMPVHLFGQMADMEAIMRIAEKHGVEVIEDAAQAIGAENGRRHAGSIGHYGCFSFFPSKNLGGAGDGGMVVCQDNRRAEVVALLRSHGSKPKYHHKVIGGNFRLDAIQAAIVLAKLPYLDTWTAARQRNAERYDRLFAESGLEVADSSWRGGQEERPEVTIPKVVTDRHIFNQYVIRVAARDQVRAALNAKGVSTEIYYPIPMHLQECFSYLNERTGAFPESERAARETLALPIFPELSDEQAQYVVQCICEFFRGSETLVRAPERGASLERS
jgi:dTDP-4-amino-4,6-dideoxygalactose transaminase